MDSDEKGLVMRGLILLLGFVGIVGFLGGCGGEEEDAWVAPEQSEGPDEAAIESEERSKAVAEFMESTERAKEASKEAETAGDTPAQTAAGTAAKVDNLAEIGEKVVAEVKRVVAEESNSLSNSDVVDGAIRQIGGSTRTDNWGKRPEPTEDEIAAIDVAQAAKEAAGAEAADAGGETPAEDGANEDGNATDGEQDT